jgi:hypothetical protein
MDHLFRSSLAVLSLLVVLFGAACKQLSPAEPTEVELEWPETTPAAPAAPADGPAEGGDPAHGSSPEPATNPTTGPARK